MQGNYGAKAYHKTAVQTASKEKILLLLYEACIRFMKRAQKAMENKNFEEKGIMIGKAQDILNELNNTLDFEVGGDIAKQLEQLYMFLFDHTTEANIENSPEKLENCINIMSTLYDGWKEAVEKQPKKAEQGHKLDLKKKNE